MNDDLFTLSVILGMLSRILVSKACQGYEDQETAGGGENQTRGSRKIEITQRERIQRSASYR